MMSLRPFEYACVAAVVILSLMGATALYPHHRDGRIDWPAVRHVQLAR